MSPSDFLYQQTFKQFMAMGYSDRDAGYVAADAVSRWKRQGGGIQGDGGRSSARQESVQAL
jgi:hypothetical protein